MGRKTLTEQLKMEFEQFWDYLETNPTRIEGFKYSLTQEAREHALNQIEPYMNFEEWLERLRKYKIPFPVKFHSTWFPLPSTRNQLDTFVNDALIKSGKGVKTAIIRGVTAGSEVHHLQMTFQQAIDSKYYNKNTEFFLTDGVQEEKEE